MNIQNASPFVPKTKRDKRKGIRGVNDQGTRIGGAPPLKTLAVSSEKETDGQDKIAVQVPNSAEKQSSIDENATPLRFVDSPNATPLLQVSSARKESAPKGRRNGNKDGTRRDAPRRNLFSIPEVSPVIEEDNQSDFHPLYPAQEEPAVEEHAVASCDIALGEAVDMPRLNINLLSGRLSSNVTDIEAHVEETIGLGPSHAWQPPPRQILQTPNSIHYNYVTAEEVGAQLSWLTLKHSDLTRNAMTAITQLIQKYTDGLLQFIPADLQNEFKVPSYKSIQRKQELKLPPMYYDLAFDVASQHSTDSEGDNSTDEADVVLPKVIHEKGLPKYPRLKYRSRRFKEQFCVSYITLQDALTFIKFCHRIEDDRAMELVVGLDAVPEAASNKISIEVFHVAWRACPNNPLPLWVATSKINKKMIDIDSLVKDVASQAKELGVKVAFFVADAVERWKLLKLKGYNSPYMCPKCTLKGVRVGPDGKVIPPKKNPSPTKEPAGTSKKKKKSKRIIGRYVYPPATFKMRTHADIVRCMNNHMLGFYGKSSLLNFEGADLSRFVPLDYMHLCCLGVTKKLIDLTIDGCANDVPRTKLKETRLSSTFYSKAFVKFRVPSDFARRLKDLDLPRMKSEEFRNFMLLYVFLFVEEYGTANILIQVWTLWTFIMRAATLPDDEYFSLKRKINLNNLMKSFQKLYVQAFGIRHCTTNFHCSSHIIAMRDAEPLTDTCAFPAESMFHRFKQGYKAGTTGTARQGAKHVLQRYASPWHNCRRTIIYSPLDEKTTKDDSLAYTKDGKMWRVITNFDGQCTAEEIYTETYRLRHPYFPGLFANFSLVGVHKIVGFSKRSTDLHVNDFMGKCMKVKNLLCKIPREILLENN